MASSPLSWLLRYIPGAPPGRVFSCPRCIAAPDRREAGSCGAHLRLKTLSARQSLRNLSTPGGGPSSVRAAENQGGGRGQWGWRGAGGGQSWTSYWPLGIAGLTLVMTGQASRAIEMDKTYDQLARQVSETPTGSASKNHFAGGLSSVIQWLHLFGTGPAGQELRRRMAISGCVDAVLRQEGVWNGRLAEAARQFRDAAPSALGPGGEAKKQVMQSFWMRETCLLALSELLLGSETVRDIVFEAREGGVLQRLLKPARDDSTAIAMQVLHESGMNRKKPLKSPIHGLANPADPLASPMQSQDFGAIAKGLPSDADLWGDSGASQPYHGADAVERGEREGAAAGSSRIWSVSQIRVLQVLAKDPRLGSIVAADTDAIACFAENLELSREGYSGFTRVLEMDRQRRVLKCLSDVSRNVTSSPAVFEDAKLQQALVDLCKSSDVVSRNLSLMCVRSLSDAGVSFARYDDGHLLSQPITPIATQDDLKAASREIHYFRLFMHVPVVMACGTAYGTLREYLKLRGRTVIPMQNLVGNAARAGLGTAIGASVVYASTVHLVKFLHKHTSEVCTSPSQVVSATGNTIAGEFGMIWALATMFPHSFGGFVLGNFVLANLAFVHPAAFGPVLVSGHTREKAF